MLSRSKPLKQRLPFGARRAAVAALIVACLGAVVLVVALAAGSYISAETENGTLAAGATAVNDSAASGGKAVKFAAAATPSPTPPPGSTCTNPTHTLPTDPNDPQSGITLSGFYVDTDTWNFAGYPGSQQTMFVCDYNSWYAMVNVNNNNHDGAVKTYPDTHKDFNSPLITSFNSVSSSFAHIAPASGADYDWAYDVWINNYGVELMIWTQSGGAQAHVPGIGITATTTLSGITYDIHKSGTYIAYDMKTTKTSGTVNVLEIMKDMIARGYISNTATLTSVQYGVEVCNTNSVNTRFDLTNFALTTN